MGILIDFEEAKKKLFSPTEQVQKSDKLDAVRKAASTFLFSRLPLQKRTFIILNSILGEADEALLTELVGKLIPYIETNFKIPPDAPKPVVAPLPEVTTDATAAHTDD